MKEKLIYLCGIKDVICFVNMWGNIKGGFYKFIKVRILFKFY